MTQFIKGMRDKLGKYVDETLAFTVEMSVDGNLVCDACCFCVDEHGKLVNEENMIFYNQVETPGKEIRYSQLGDKINFDIQLENLPSEIQKLVFTFSIDGEGKVEDARQFSLCVKQNDVACIVVETNQQDFIKGKSVILAEIYRKNGWKFANVSGGFAGNLEQLVEFFGAQASYESEIPEQEAGCIESDFVEVKPEEMANEFEDEDYDRDESEAEDYAEDADEESEVNDFEDEDYGDEESEDSEDENYDDSDDYSEEDDYDESDDDSEDDDYDESDDDSEEAYDDDEESDEEDYDEEDYDDEDYDDEEYDEEDYDDFMEVEPTEIEPEKAGKLTMKKIKVNEKCSGCGFCVVNCPYLEENNEGNAQPVLGKMIAESDLAAMEKLVQECPERALFIEEDKQICNGGIEGVKEVIEDLKKKCEEFQVDKVDFKSIKFTPKDCYLEVPSSRLEYRRNYSSESAAKSAAKEEFNRLCYSESAYRPMLKKMFVEYKVAKLKPFYNMVDNEECYYYKYNEQIRTYLAEAYAQIHALLGEEKIAESWKEFSFYFGPKDSYVQILREFDDQSTCSGIIAELKDTLSNGINDYILSMDFDYDEETEMGFFGEKTKKKWYFSDFGCAAKEYISDLKWAADYMSRDITENAERFIKNQNTAFVKEIKKCFGEKISELEKLVL